MYNAVTFCIVPVCSITTGACAPDGQSDTISPPSDEKGNYMGFCGSWYSREKIISVI